MPPAGRSVQAPEAAVSGLAAAVRGGAGVEDPCLEVQPLRWAHWDLGSCACKEKESPKFLANPVP